jgi:ADP-ribosyl-[dinitrogen reductase] hydrolase
MEAESTNRRDRQHRERRDRAVGALVGLAVGDAVGTTLEFTQRDRGQPITDMVGGGPFGLKPGAWTDDTSMALCLADSLLARRAFDARDLMERFCRWWRLGENSVTGACFDIGTTTSVALARYERDGDPFAGRSDPRSSGNGSLMRLAPVAIAWHADAAAAEQAARDQSRTTHASPACLEACAVFARLLVLAIGGAARETILAPQRWNSPPEIADIAAGGWRAKKRTEISSSGYVAHTLEAALWCVNETADFRSAVLLAANLGDDADTVAAVTGQLAGALYGWRRIPEDWRAKLAWHDRIHARASALFDLF